MTGFNFNLNLGELTGGILSSKQKSPLKKARRLSFSRERNLTSPKYVQYNKHRRSRISPRLPCRAV